MLQDNYLKSIGHLLRNGYTLSTSIEGNFICNKIGAQVLLITEVQLQFILDHFKFTKVDHPACTIYSLVVLNVDMSIDPNEEKPIEENNENK